ncbi:hypothetical protein [Desulfotomaculum copahuensis]|uniref:Uncharacterized protein n=1 Tax=Desulfotomaculum copahuensis TaxID=1838280 RepID=A0A1B7LCG0_9FIRM|nr:hypothetical protein [Desulfotomaculum copahuensis]OAT80398.1 hypothetical protein A6M21_13610 [Desulfotomaculum copahuensis]
MSVRIERALNRCQSLVVNTVIDDDPEFLPVVKDEQLLSSLVARCLVLPEEARLSVLEHWEMDLLIEEKKVPSASGKKKEELIFPSAVHEPANTFRAKNPKDEKS